LSISVLGKQINLILPDRVQLGNHTFLPIDPQRVAFTVLDTEEYVNTSYTMWEGLNPAGKGFVRIDDEYYLVAMYHQIHVSRPDHLPCSIWS
jgi:hypothetical protein